ncbi:MAG: META domain-containing protein [Pyrinomonadaceae bacterium]
MKYLLTLALIIFSSGAVIAAGQDGLRGIQWTLIYANGQAVAGSMAYFEIERGSGRFVGSTGCNRMFGKVEVDGETIEFSNIGTTKKLCETQPGGVSETSFLNGLNNVVRYSRDASRLSLLDSSGQIVLRFKRLGKQPPVVSLPAGGQLEGKWELESIAGRTGGGPIKGAFIRFDTAKGSAGGNSSCNVFGGEYSVSGSKITIREMVSTMRACVEDDRMAIEREFLDGLRAADRFEITGDQLFLYKGEKLLLTLREDKS